MPVKHHLFDIRSFLLAANLNTCGFPVLSWLVQCGEPGRSWYVSARPWPLGQIQNAIKHTIGPLPRELRETFWCAKHRHEIWSYALHDTGPAEGQFKKHFVVQNIDAKFEYCFCGVFWIPGFNLCFNDVLMVFNMNLYRVMRKTKSYTKFRHSSMIVAVSLPRELRETFCSARKWHLIFSFTPHTI